MPAQPAPTSPSAIATLPSYRTPHPTLARPPASYDHSCFMRTSDTTGSERTLHTFCLFSSAPALDSRFLFICAPYPCPTPAPSLTRARVTLALFPPAQSPAGPHPPVFSPRPLDISCAILPLPHGRLTHSTYRPTQARLTTYTPRHRRAFRAAVPAFAVLARVSARYIDILVSRSYPLCRLCVRIAVSAADAVIILASRGR